MRSWLRAFRPAPGPAPRVFPTRVTFRRSSAANNPIGAPLAPNQPGRDLLGLQNAKPIQIAPPPGSISRSCLLLRDGLTENPFGDWILSVDGVRNPRAKFHFSCRLSGRRRKPRRTRPLRSRNRKLPGTVCGTTRTKGADQLSPERDCLSHGRIADCAGTDISARATFQQVLFVQAGDQ